MKKLLLSMLMLSSALTIANAQTTILVEDFEGGTFPSSWSQTTNATDGGWVAGINTALQSTGFPIDPHTKMLCTNDDKCNCDKSSDILISPTLDLTTYTNVFMTYDNYYFNGSYNGVTEEAKILVSTDGGTTWTDLITLPGNTAGWQTNAVNLTAYAGNANVKVGFKYNDGGDWLYGWAIDNVSIFEPLVGVDLSVTSTIVGKVDPRPAFVGFPKYLVNLPLTVKSKVTNSATVPITSFDYSWSDGVSTFSQSFTGLNILPLESYEFNSTTQYTTAAGVKTITGSITNINNGAVELNTADNSSTYDVEGITPNPDKKYFAEEGTGTWCGWCPRGAVYMDYMRESYPSQFVGVAVHNGDAMTVTAYDAGIGGIISGYPSVVANGHTVIDPSELEGDFINQIQNAPDVTVGGTAVINLATNQMTVDLTGTFSSNLTGTYKFMAAIIQDSVTGYTQNNYYTGNANGAMGGFEVLPATVPASQVKFDFVARALLGTFNGQTNSIPASVTANTPYTYQFTNAVPSTWNKQYLSVAAVVLTGSGASRTVLNAANIPVTFSTGVNEESGNLKGSYIYPSVTQDVVNLSLSNAKSQALTVTVTDALGKVVLSQNLGNIQAGNSQMFWNVSSLASGMYYLNVLAPDGKLTQKFIKE